MIKGRIKVWKGIPKFLKIEELRNKEARKDDYYRLWVCDNEEEMYNLVDKVEKNKIERNYIGRCYCETKRYYLIDTETKEMEYVKTSPYCGDIFLVKDSIYQDVISHETAHAVLGYFNRKIKKPEKLIYRKKIEKQEINCDNYKEINKRDAEESDNYEELFCYMVGNIANEIAHIISNSK